MTAFLEKYDLLNTNQFGFQQKRGTTDALVNFLEGIREDWENGFKEVNAVFIDLKKAFDTVEQNLLLEKLENIGMRGPVHKLLKSYLRDRQQCVKSVEFRSEFLPIEYGVLQGSVLGPLLFLVYINDIQEFCGDSTAILFADDAVLKQNVYSSKEKFEKSLESVADYFLQNKLTLNLEKTHLVSLNGIRKSSQQEIILQNDAICQKTSLKYLGVHIDEKLNFNRHILELCAKLSKFSGLFYKLRSILTTAQLLVTYKVYVQPILNYGVLVYGTSSKTTLQPLEAKVKQISRIIFKKRKTESTLQNPDNYKMHSIKDLHIFELFKKLTETLRSECEINSLKLLITNKEIESVELKRTSSRQLKSTNAVSGLSPKRLGVRIRKLLNFILKFNPNFISEVQILSKKELKRYQYSFRDNYIRNNQQIVSLIY